MSGRFAPSPTGRLHVGNLRTAVLAWLLARSEGRGFLVRMEDLDQQQASEAHGAAQLDDLATVGLDWDGEVTWQGTRFPLYREAIERLRDEGLVYECFCSRREIAAQIESAPVAPHGPVGGYPGTCRDLSAAALAARRASGRPPALRLRTDGQMIDFTDRLLGAQSGAVDDVVLQRNDGVPAYNLAVVVDDAAQGITQVVRGHDLLDSTPRHILLQRLLSLPRPEYVHVPLVLGDDGERLAKRHGAVTLADLDAAGHTAREVVAWIVGSLQPGTAARTPSAALTAFDLGRVPADDVIAEIVPEADTEDRH